MSAGVDRGLLLVNLGTPASPRVGDVRRYLREFLMDPRVLDISAFARRLLVELVITPFRAPTSAAAYEKIWTEDGSPLLVHGLALRDRVRELFGEGIVVELAMRYGEPSIEGALRRMSAAGVRRLAVFPLYPQYSSAATGSSLERAFEVAGGFWNVSALTVVSPFFDDPGYIEAYAEKARPVVANARAERVFFSFHGLPERQIRKSDRTGEHCLESSDCCGVRVAANAWCYRAQCFETARLLGDAIGVDPDRRVVCFQSRLGRTPWIRPYTDEVLPEAARAGVRRAAIVSPAFVADCLETLEELAIRAVADWKRNGGEELAVSPAPNASPRFARAVVDLATAAAPWLRAEARS